MATCSDKSHYDRHDRTDREAKANKVMTVIGPYPGSNERSLRERLIFAIRGLILELHNPTSYGPAAPGSNMPKEIEDLTANCYRQSMASELRNR